MSREAESFATKCIHALVLTDFNDFFLYKEIVGNSDFNEHFHFFNFSQELMKIEAR